MSEVGAGEAYDRHVGRYASELAVAFADFAEIGPPMRALDVGCGPGALAAELARRTGAERVAAADPSEAYVETCRLRVPGPDVRVGPAEALPFGDDAFDAVLAQLVVQTLDDPQRAARELVRVATPGGVIAACVWDFRDGMPLMSSYWAAATAVDPDGAARARGDMTNPLCTTEGLRGLWSEAGIEQIETGELAASAGYEDLDDAWWSFDAGVSPSGAYCRSLDQRLRDALRTEFGRRLGSPPGPFQLTARAWSVSGRAPGGRSE